MTPVVEAADLVDHLACSAPMTGIVQCMLNVISVRCLELSGSVLSYCKICLDYFILSVFCIRLLNWLGCEFIISRNCPPMIMYVAKGILKFYNISKLSS